MTEPDEREAFHAAIWKSPDDDLPRLVYADWLDERNEHDAATFLRLLCTVRTCPPDVDRLRPLVADFRRAMVKVPPQWIDEVCPVPPAVVVGPWVDVDHEANRKALEWVREERRKITTAESELVTKPLSRLSPTEDTFVGDIWEELVPVLSPAASCLIDEVPALVDVWSGVVMAVATRRLEDWWVIYSRNSSSYGWAVTHNGPLGPEGDLDDTFAKPEALRNALAEFDPANRPG